MEDLTINLKIRSREGIIFDGRAYAFSSVNAVGPFDILPIHANFVGTFKDQMVIHLVDGSARRMDVKSGIVRARENNVDVFVGV